VRVNSRSVLIAAGAVAAADGEGGLGLSVRVLSYARKADLGRRVTRLAGWAARAGQPVARVEAGIGRERGAC
jgi:hypothetical protein